MHIVQLDRILANLGPEGQEARGMSAPDCGDPTRRKFGRRGEANVNLRAPLQRGAGEKLFAQVANLPPTTGGPALCQESRPGSPLPRCRKRAGLLYEQAGGSLSGPSLSILVFWLVRRSSLASAFLHAINTTVVVRALRRRALRRGCDLSDPGDESTLQRHHANLQRSHPQCPGRDQPIAARCALRSAPTLPTGRPTDKTKECQSP